MSDAEYLTGSSVVRRTGDDVHYVIDQQPRMIEKKLSGHEEKRATASSEYAFYLNIKRELEEMRSSAYPMEQNNG